MEKVMAKQFMSWEEVEDGFRDALDCGDMVRIGSLEYYPSIVLEAVDPIAFRIGVSEYADMLAEDYAVEGVNEEEADSDDEEE
jgi:hypothetical protein